jgi:hypothetical protein
MNLIPLACTQRLLFAAAVASVPFLVAFRFVPRSTWSSPTCMVLVAGILVVAWLASFATGAGTLSPEAVKAIQEGRIGSPAWWPLIKRVLLWVGILLVIGSVFCAVRIIERT